MALAIDKVNNGNTKKKKQENKTRANSNNIDSIVRDIKSGSYNAPTIGKTNTSSYSGGFNARKDTQNEYTGGFSAKKDTKNEYSGGFNAQSNKYKEESKSFLDRIGEGVKSFFNVPTNKEDKTRKDFYNDGDYEAYLVENKINPWSNKNANDYILNKTKASGGTNPADTYNQMQKDYKKRQNTEKIYGDYLNNNLADEDKSAIDQYFEVYNKQTGAKLNANEKNQYVKDMNDMSSVAQKLNETVDKLNADYQNGLIDTATYQDAYAEVQNQWANNQNRAKQFEDLYER